MECTYISSWYFLFKCQVFWFSNFKNLITFSTGSKRSPLSFATNFKRVIFSDFSTDSSLTFSSSLIMGFCNQILYLKIYIINIKKIMIKDFSTNLTFYYELSGISYINTIVETYISFI